MNIFGIHYGYSETYYQKETVSGCDVGLTRSHAFIGERYPQVMLCTLAQSLLLMWARLSYINIYESSKVIIQYGEDHVLFCCSLYIATANKTDSNSNNIKWITLTENIQKIALGENLVDNVETYSCFDLY
ncbi:hypothetical protein V1478_005554 [Vespula squamosa]|uniref:Uncharacterized protein n=1 Tax=Vespula squamosa TaxID=30214 RepID=A0ABD2BAL2_VESSQ